MAAAFLGGRALDGRPGVASWIAVVAFALLTLGSVYVLTPARTWGTMNSAEQLLAAYVEGDPSRSVDEMYRDLALYVEGDFRAITKRLARLTTVVQGECVLLIVEILALFIALQEGVRT